MRKFYFLAQILLILLMQNLFLTSVSANTETQPAGLSIQESLRVPVFYAATYGFTPKSLEDYVNNPMPFKMEARYIVDKFSSRQNNQLWLNAMLLSNSRDELKTFEDALLMFSRLIKTDMYKGDRLVFDLNPVHGTSISINDVPLGVIKDLKFQSALVAIWYGDRQSSKTFAEQIRTVPSGKMLDEFNALTLKKGQQNRFKSLQNEMLSPKIAQQAATATVPEVETKKPSIQPAAKTVEDKNTSVTAKPPLKKSAEKTQTAKNSTQIAEKKVSNKPAPVVAEKDVQSDSNQAPKRNEQPLPEKRSDEKTPIPQPAKVAKAENLSVVDQMFNSLRQDYQIDVKQYIEQNARPAPPFKVRKKPEGKAQLKVTLANQNNKVVVLDTQILSGNFEDDVVEELHKSIKRLKAIPPIPEAIGDQQIDIQVTLDFEKCKRSMSTWICF